MTGRGSGILMHISSLPSAYGIGDFGPEAYKFADFLYRTGQRYWQILPLNPTCPACGNSPYFSRSAFAGNPLLISFDMLLEEGLIDCNDIDPVPKFTADKVDYHAVTEYKNSVLDKTFMKFKSNDEYTEFCSKNSGWLEDFALFMALKTEFEGKVWNEWPDEFRDRKPEAMERSAKKFSDSIEKEKFLQYIIFKQWFDLRAYCNSKGIEVIGDIPIYVSYDSCDVWADTHIFKLDDKKGPYVVSGVPPDYFSETGQLWNNPVYDWGKLKETGYAWWVKRLEHTFNWFDIVRIDHFRGLVQYWEIPSGEDTAINGKWQDVPTNDFFDNLIERFSPFPVIAEDLGIITDDVRAVMKHYGFAGMKVLLFAFGADDPEHPYLPHNYIKNCIVYTGTHDNNTFVGWFEKEASADEKERLLRYLDPDSAHTGLNWEVIRLIWMSVADTAIVPVQDILALGQDARMNEPSISDGNWRWRVKPDELTGSHEKILLEMTETYGRARSSGGQEAS